MYDVTGSLAYCYWFVIINCQQSQRTHWQVISLLPVYNEVFCVFLVWFCSLISRRPPVVLYHIVAANGWCIWQCTCSCQWQTQGQSVSMLSLLPDIWVGSYHLFAVDFWVVALLYRCDTIIEDTSLIGSRCECSVCVVTEKSSLSAAVCCVSDDQSSVVYLSRSTTS